MIFRPLIAALACLLAGLSALAAASGGTSDKLGGLLANSPFGVPRAGTTGSSAAEPLEFRAVLEENGTRYFSIYDTTTRASNWVDLNDPVKDFTVKEYDADQASVMVEYQGRPMKLALKRAAAVVAPLPVAVPGAAAAQVATRNLQAVQTQGQAVQTPVPPAQLQQIRDEIARRRTLRAQGAPAPGATTATTTTTTPPPPPRP